MKKKTSRTYGEFERRKRVSVKSEKTTVPRPLSMEALSSQLDLTNQVSPSKDLTNQQPPSKGLTNDEDSSHDNNSEGGETICPFAQNHDGKKFLDAVVSLPIDFVFTLIFIQEDLMGNVYRARKATDIVNSPWEHQDSENKDSPKCRQVTYAISVNIANMGTKLAYVTEKQVMRHSQAGECYVVEIDSFSSGVPYADSFYIYSHFCLTKEPKGKTKIMVWGNVKYKKTVWGLVKGMLEKNSYSGFDFFLAEMMSQLNSVVDRSHGKANRPRVPVRTKSHARSPSHGYKRHHKTGKDEIVETSKDSGKQTSNCYLWIVVAMSLSFLLLILSNYILYTKLSHLEHLGRQKYRSSEIVASFKRPLGSAGNSFESVTTFFNQLQEVQDKKKDTWKTTITQACEHLQQIQDSLEYMMGSLQESEKTLYSALQDFSSNRKSEIVPEENISDSGLISDGSND